MLTDPIIDEVRKNREALAAEHGNDLQRLFRAIKEIEAASGRAYVKREPKLVAQLVGDRQGKQRR
jgi:hypothetical protein